jgi:uncharacterized repeat protein (TIGR02543 family)
LANIRRLRLVDDNRAFEHCATELSSVSKEWARLVFRSAVGFAGLTVLAVLLISQSSASASTRITRPTAPRHVTAVPGTNSAIVSFLPPSSNGGSRIIDYYVQVSPRNSTDSALRRCPTIRCSIRGLVNGVTYHFLVAAVNKFQVGIYSAASNRVTPRAPVPSEPTVTFNANGGLGTMANETETDGTTVALTPNAYSYSGYTLTGWNTSPNGSGTGYADGSAYVFTMSATLYAQWTIAVPSTTATVTVTFNANGGSGTMSPESENLNVSAALTTNAFTYSGYTFTGWNTSANGSGTSFTNSELVKFTGSVALYAQWTAVASFPGAGSTNWSGYVLPTTALDTLASGEWTVPTLNCAATPNGSSATWVGIGGVTWSSGGSSGALLQTGIEDDCVNGVQVDSGWFELLPSIPNYSETFSSFPVSPGNTIEAIVGYVNGRWVTDLENLSTGLSGVFLIGDGWEVVTTATSTSVGGLQGYATGTSYSGAYSVEWIEEDVTSASSGALFGFPNYGTVTFSNLKTTLSSWTLPSSDAYEIVQNGVALSIPGAVSNDGFTVSYTGP